MRCEDVTLEQVNGACVTCEINRKDFVVIPERNEYECPYYKEPEMAKIAVHVPNKYLWEAVEKNEIDVRGKKWGGDTTSKYDGWDNEGGDSCIKISGDVLAFSCKQLFLNNSYTIITVDEYFKRFGGDAPIKIGQHEVEFKDGGFNVGGQFVAWDTFDKIAAKRPTKER